MQCWSLFWKKYQHVFKKHQLLFIWPILLTPARSEGRNTYHFWKKATSPFFRSKLCGNYWAFVPNKPIIFAGSGVKFLTYFLSLFTWESYSSTFAWSSLRSYFWSVFSCIQTEYGKTRSISPYSVRMQENTDHK